ncbi:hypothetical protein [Micromonospora sp. RTGN7]|uniref:hypothetical protein n=1 Tax=Micromonospora sp. RTGN7 TaxID=3016526 RepID=UPI0029FF52E9|nr:hypothetical protein [Micromonospora sp. RTGN7]
MTPTVRPFADAVAAVEVLRAAGLRHAVTDNDATSGLNAEFDYRPAGRQWRHRRDLRWWETQRKSLVEFTNFVREISSACLWRS